MLRFIIRSIISFLPFLFIITGFVSGEENMDYLSLYDFNDTKRVSKFEWEGFTDQVMGGESEIATRLMSEGGEIFIRMEGEVSLEDNGGFIQIRLKLADSFKVYDASGYDGIRLFTRGEGSDYYLFVRTNKTVFPWQFYKARVALREDWQSIDIPWSAFEVGDYGRIAEFNPANLKSVALVAYGAEFNAEIDLMNIGLFKRD